MKITKDKIIKVLKTIPDPELNISIVDLGLIYDVKITKKGEVTILMTLTSMGCPLFDMIKDSIEEKVKAVPGVTNVTIKLTFEPIWNIDKMTKEAREQLGI